MDASSGFKTKEEFLEYLSRDPRMVAFSGWDQYGTPKLTDDGHKQTWRTAQAAPWYDADVEQALLGAQSQFLGSPRTNAYPDSRNFQEKPKYSPEVSEVTRFNNKATGNLGKENTESMSYAGQIADVIRKSLFRK